MPGPGRAARLRHPRRLGQYDQITDDLYDTRVPLHNELAFQHGIHFDAKVVTSDIQLTRSWPTINY
jgi:hypothetical protein